MSRDVVLAGVRAPGAQTPRDVVVRDGVVEAVVPPGTPVAGAERVGLDGRWLVGGLWDAHVHMTQWVVRRRRLDLTGTGSASAVLEVVRAGLRADPGSTRPLVGYGFRDALWRDVPSRAALDALAGGRPVVLVGGDLHCGWLSSGAAAWLGVETGADGMLREEPWMAALDRLDRADPPDVQDYRDAAVAAARRGVVGVVDFENDDNLARWPERVAAGVDALRVEASVWPDRLEAAVTAGLRTGDALDPVGLVRVGRLKVLSDGSLNTRTAYCWDPYPGGHGGAGVEVVPAGRLAELLVRAARHGIGAAVHAIGDRSLSSLLDVLERTGLTAVVEHAQLVRRQDLPRMARLVEAASVQPEHAMDDRDVVEVHWAGRGDRAFAFRSLLDAGVELRLGSDAPVAPLDPWVSMAAAVGRTRDGRDAWHPEQRLTRPEALAASTRGRAQVTAGDPADLVVLDADPLSADAAVLRTMPVAATMVGGRWTWREAGAGAGEP